MPIPFPFLLLLLAICAVWLPRPARGWPARVPPWAVLHVLAVAAACAQGVLDLQATAALALLAVLAVWAARAHGTLRFWPARVLLLAVSAALLAHQWPGFHNPVVIDGVRWSAGAPPFTQHLNFDKGSVGLVLVALLALRLQRGDGVGRMAAATAVVGAATAAAVLGLAVLAGVVRPDLKWPPQAALFLLVNLFLTCVAEQAVFRTLVQDPLRCTRAGPWGAVLLSALLFGLAHAAGGGRMVLLAGLAGLGHALAYERTRRIEAPILVHFGLNAVHFVGFSYPGLGVG